MKKKIIALIIIMMSLVILGCFFFRDRYINENIRKCRSYGKVFEYLAKTSKSQTEILKLLDLINKCNKVGVDIRYVK